MEARLLTGKEGFKALLEDVLKEGKDWLIIGATGKSVLVLPSFSVQIQKKRERAGIPARYLLYDTPLARKRGPEWAGQKRSEIRYMSKGFDSPITIYIYGNKSAILLWTEDKPLAVMVDDPRVAEGFRKYFEFLWEMFKPK